MRALIDVLDNPHPVGHQLPAVYQDDEFILQFCSGLDAVLAPVISTLDTIDAYLDPRLAPEDFLTWLATWVGVELEERWPLARQREVVSEAVDLYRWRGTTRGLRDVVRLYTGVEPEIEESGGTSWSSAPGSESPGAAAASLVVRVRIDDPALVDEGRLDAIVRASKPAHIPHRIEIASPADATTDERD